MIVSWMYAAAEYGSERSPGFMMDAEFLKHFCCMKSLPPSYHVGCSYSKIYAVTPEP